MRVDVSLEFRFLRTPDGRVWTEGAFPRSFWDRYLEVFDEVRIIARAETVDDVGDAAQRVDGKDVEFWPVPFYRGPVQFVRSYRRIRPRLRAAVNPGDAVIMRVASPIAAVLSRELARRRQPFALEVVGDPEEAFRRGSIRHPLRPVARRWLTGSLRRLAAEAVGVSYVTSAVLQRRYPAGPTAFTTHYSSIDLSDDWLAARPRSPDQTASRLVTVAALDQRYKGVDVLLEAVARLVAGGTDLSLVVVGDGALRRELEALAVSLRLDGRVEFVGQVPPAGVVTRLDEADLFVLASRSEGLPRAMVEAMARGLPCVATAVGGVPELLPEGALVPADAPEALAVRLGRVIDDPSWLAEMSSRNLEKAAEFRSSVLGPRRNAYYRHVREVAESWVADS